MLALCDGYGVRALLGDLSTERPARRSGPWWLESSEWTRADGMARRAFAGAALAVLLGALALAGRAQAEPVTVMTFNIWYGGVQVDFPSIGRAIRAADADIVGIQEPEGGLRRIARSAGLPYYDPTLHVISRYPLFAANVGGVRIGYAATDLESRRGDRERPPHRHPVRARSAVRDGGSAAAVLKLERETRLPDIKPYLRPLAGSLGAACRSSSPET